jgi:alanine-synthesizing transaminase
MEATESVIKLSDRMDFLPPYLFGKINKVKQKKRRAGIDIIDLAMGNPSDPTPQPIIDKLREAAQDPRNHRYSAAAGIYNFRKEIAKYYETHYQVSLNPDDEVLSTIGSKEGVSHLSLALLGPGDTAIVPVPAFPVHTYSVVIAGGNVIHVPIVDDEKFLKTVDHLCKTTLPKPKVLFLNYPHNPTTKTVEIGFFEEIVKMAKKNNLIVVHDFAYARITFDGYNAPSLLQVKGAKDVGVEFGTMSKSYNMAGWRVGYCAGNSTIVDALEKIKGYYDYGLFQAIQIAAIIALRDCEDFIKTQVSVYENRRDVLCDGLNSIGWKLEKPKASMFVWTQIPEQYREMGSLNFAIKLMKEAEVAVSPGVGFGKEGEGYIRMALVENENRTRQAIKQIKRVLNGKSNRKII